MAVEPVCRLSKTTQVGRFSSTSHPPLLSPSSYPLLLPPPPPTRVTTGPDSSSSGRGGSKADKKERVDSSYVTFLLDLLGAIAAGARRVVLDAEAEREVVRSALLPIDLHLYSIIHYPLSLIHCPI